MTTPTESLTSEQESSYTSNLRVVIPILPDVYTDGTHPGSLAGTPTATSPDPAFCTPIRPVLSPYSPPPAPARPLRNPMQLGPTAEDSGFDAIDFNIEPEPDTDESEPEESCEWDCGELACGCINICRGRCVRGRCVRGQCWNVMSK